MLCFRWTWWCFAWTLVSCQSDLEKITMRPYVDINLRHVFFILASYVWASLEILHQTIITSTLLLSVLLENFWMVPDTSSLYLLISDISIWAAVLFWSYMLRNMFCHLSHNLILPTSIIVDRKVSGLYFDLTGLVGKVRNHALFAGGGPTSHFPYY